MPKCDFKVALLCRTEACNFIKNETLAQIFSCGFRKIFKSTFFTKHLGEMFLRSFPIVRRIAKTFQLATSALRSTDRCSFISFVRNPFNSREKRKEMQLAHCSRSVDNRQVNLSS